MEKRQRLIEALITLLGDDDGTVVKEAREKLLSMGRQVIPHLREGLSEYPLPIRIRLRQVIQWLDTDPRKKYLPPVSRVSK